MAMPQVRPSRLPLAFECTSSLMPCEAPLGGPSDASDLGSAGHYVFGAVVLGKPVDVQATADSYGVDADELDVLYGCSHSIWRAVRPHFSDARVERHVESAMLGGGTADLLHHDGDTAAVLDAKCGYIRRGYQHQLAGYAYNVREQFGMPRSGVIQSAIGWLRFGEVDAHAYGEAELDAWAKSYEALERKIGKEYNAGRHCGFCPRRGECAAYRAEVGTAASTLALVKDGDAGITPAVLATLYPRVQVLARALKVYDGMLKSALTGGVRLPVGDGTVLYLAEQRRCEIDPLAAWPVLQDAGFTSEELADVIEIHKGKVEKVIEGKAARGKKKAAREDLFEKLEAAGAVKTTISPRLSTGKEE